MGSFSDWVLLAGCGNQAKASTPKTSGQPQLTRLTKQVKNLYADSKYEMPAKQLSEAALTKANTQKDKVYKLRSDLSKAQQKTFKVDQQQLQAAKKIFSVQDTLNTELDKDQVLKDEDFKIQVFNNDFTYLQAHKAKFAATIKDKATLLDREVKAVALVKAATTGDPDQTKINQARDAINAVNGRLNMALKRLISAVKERPASNARLPMVTQLLLGSPMIMRHQNLSKCPGDVLFGTVMLSTGKARQRWFYHKHHDVRVNQK